MFQRASSVILFVRDIRQSQAWYEDVLRIAPRYTDERFALFEIADTKLCFHLADEKSPVTTGGTVAYWWVDDFDEMIKRVLYHRGTLYRGPIPTEDGEQICQIKDPFGNVFGLEGRIPTG